MTLEDDLRSALQHKADGIEPGPESYVKLAAQVDSTSPASHRLGDRARFRGIRFMGRVASGEWRQRRGPRGHTFSIGC